MLKSCLWHILVASIAIIVVLFPLSIVFGMQSDSDNLSPLMTQIYLASNYACLANIVFDCSSYLEIIDRLGESKA